MKKIALVTGVTGQDGAFLAELLLDKGYEVHGLMRRVSTGGTWRIDHIKHKLKLHEGDLTDRPFMFRLLRNVCPDEVYNLAAMSHVHSSFNIPEYTAEVDGMAVLHLLEEIRNLNSETGEAIRMYHASTSECFGSSPPPQNELTPFRPRSPYAVAKVFAHNMCGLYRSAYNMHVSCGILHNHESCMRGESFVTRKIARGAARIALGRDKELKLGNLEARRDWGHARDYVAGMYLMLQQELPDDYVLATGETHSVAEFCEAAFSRVKLDWRKYVTVDPQYMRPAEVHDLCGDASKAKRVLGWSPKITFSQLVNEMVDAELTRARGGGLYE